MKIKNIKGFRRKLLEIINDNDKINQILELIPDDIILPLFYKGDKVILKDGEEVTILECSRKNGSYIYYFELDGYIVYEYENDILINRKYVETV